jgi:hypothetical protein
MKLYDYIYVDLEKVISLYSQITGGVVEIREATSEHVQTSDNKRKYDFKVFKHEAGGTGSDMGGLKEVTKPHHSLLSELEDELIRHRHLIDLSIKDSPTLLKDVTFRQQLKNTFCLKVTGYAVIEDYERIKSTAAVFPEVTKIINKSIEMALQKAPDYIALKNQMTQLEENNKQNKDRETRTRISHEIGSLKKTIEQRISELAKVGQVEPWILDGLKTWIDAFLPGIINLRMYPSADRLDEHIFGHLKRQCFEDRDSTSFHFTYGSIPTEQMTMIGIITSVPMENRPTFNPLVEFQQEHLTNDQAVEKAFRGLFRGFDGIEQMIRTCRYPRVLVYPLMVYRGIATPATS